MAVEVVGYWLEVEILSLTFDRPNMNIKFLPGRSDPQLPKKGNIKAKIIEELVLSALFQNKSLFRIFLVRRVVYRGGQSDQREVHENSLYQVC